MTDQLLDHDLLSRVSHIPLEARQGMSGTVSGRHRSVQRGSSIEFAEYRKYVPGDDTKRLDWKAFARSDRYFVKEFEADTNLRAYMIIDCSGSMGFRSQGSESKYVRACRIAANLSYVAIGQGDAVGMACSQQEAREDQKASANRFLFIPPSRRPAHMRSLISRMNAVQPSGPTSLAADLHEFAGRIPRRGLVCVFSDLFVKLEELRNALRHLRFCRHDIAVFHFIDHIETGLTIERPVRFVDMEGPAAVVAEPALIREDYRRVVADYLRGTRQACLDVNADYMMVRDSDAWQDVVMRFLTGRVRKKK